VESVSAIKELTDKLADPTLNWNVAISFGGQYVIKQAITTTDPQLLYVCDDIICHPIRFSSYYSWHDGTGQNLTRIFPNHQEAWDHTNETNPTTSAPYDGNIGGVVGYQGYFVYVDLTDGTSKSRVYISKRNYPQLQILIFNKGTLNIVVNDPPSTFGLQKYTNGTAGSGNTTIGQNQYVVFYKTINPTIDTSNGVFAVGPIGSSKIYTNELYAKALSKYTTLNFNLYLGIKSTTDKHIDAGIWYTPESKSATRNSDNVSGYRNIGRMGIRIYDTDPAGGTWEEGVVAYYIATGWAEDSSGNVKFIMRSDFSKKHTVKWNERANYTHISIYDADLDEWFCIKTVNPIVNVHSYGQAGAVINPATFEAVYPTETVDAGQIDATVSYGIDPNDNILQWTTKPATTWTYYDAYALANCFNSPESVCLATVALGIYTDDTAVSMPSDPRTAFALGGASTYVMRWGLQIKPFMDRDLSAGKTYAVITRLKRFPNTMSGNDLKNWATKVRPKALTSSEWNALLSVLPLSKNLAGAVIVSGTYTVSAPTTATPNSNITVSGSSPRNGVNVYVALVDPNTYSVISSASGTTDSNGNYSITLNIPSSVSVGNTYRIYVVIG
jgi:hypothetical protein